MLSAIKINMYFFKIFLTILASCALTAVASVPVSVQVFMESLCPDTRNFIKYHLAPVMETMSSAVDLELVIFGKTKFKVTVEQGVTDYDFACQHGPEECKMNQFMLCGAKRLSAQPMAKTVELVRCLMLNRIDSESARICAAKYDLDYDDLRFCAQGVEGLQLHVDAGRRTNALRRFPTFIPWVVIDGVRNPAFLYDFQSNVCASYTGADRDDYCS